MAIVIVEGVDGSGKTTLLRNLRQHSPTYFWIASSSGRPKTQAELEEALFWIGQCAYLKLPVICDRFPLISEAVYGPVIRGRSILDLLSKRSFGEYAEMLSENVDRIIYCRPPMEIIRENIDKNPQMAGVLPKLTQLVQVYDNLMGDIASKTWVRKYDYTQPWEYNIHDMVFGAKKNG